MSHGEWWRGQALILPPGIVTIHPWVRCRLDRHDSVCILRRKGDRLSQLNPFRLICQQRIHCRRPSSVRAISAFDFPPSARRIGTFPTFPFLPHLNWWIASPKIWISFSLPQQESRIRGRELFEIQNRFSFYGSSLLRDPPRIHRPPEEMYLLGFKLIQHPSERTNRDVISDCSPARSNTRGERE
jgi:hypothetical protein